jgi:hypothetical protein
MSRAYEYGFGVEVVKASASLLLSEDSPCETRKGFEMKSTGQRTLRRLKMFYLALKGALFRNPPDPS